MKGITPYVWTLMALLTLWSSCQSDAVPSPAEKEWEVRLSRAETGSTDPVTVALRYNGMVSYGTLVPSDTPDGKATWSEKPTWPTDQTTPVEVITFYPHVTTLPATVSATEGKTYRMDYTTATAAQKPQTFAFQHLMAQLEVHIQLHDDAEHHYRPSDAVVALYTSATVDYPHKTLTNPRRMDTAFSLGYFDREDESYGSDENWVNTAQVVIPQNLRAGVPCLTFTAGDKSYTFTPEKDIVLTAGQKTSLYLGVAFEQDGIILERESVTIGQWQGGEDLGNGEAE